MGPDVLPRLVATDLDGTLIRSDGTVSAYTHDVLRRVRDAGVEVVGVTGRGPRLRTLSAAAVDVSRYLVCAQGGFVLDLETGGVLRATRIAGPVAAQAVELIEAQVGPVLVTVEAGEADAAPLHGDPAFAWPYPDPWEPADRASMFAGELLKLFVRAPAMDVEEFFAVARSVVPPSVGEVTYAGQGFVEICPTGVTKAAGLAVVCDVLGVPAADVLAFGDMPNDVPMLSWAGRGVAVANAHPSLKAVAEEVARSNDDDGVAVYLEALLADEG
ncbi:HAD family hydrolase [Cryptosporangium sp. NPDC051539]|uniref:HAD family hydrolase n=1 Tax=Cryptosporangium sp. NPDC051539 TaxID=3363962 RepID=UPI003798F105